MTTSSSPRRIRVVGITGAGKTTLARQIAARLDIRHIELDEVFWSSGWTHREIPDAQRELHERVAHAPEGWVTCGNWQSRIGTELDDADLVVWLDHPRRLVMARVIRRTLGRLLVRRTLWHGNRERLSGLVSRDPEENIVLWTWVRYAETQERCRALAAAGTVPVVRLRGARAVRRWVDTLG